MLTLLVTSTVPDLRHLMLKKLFTRSTITSDRLLWSYSWIKYYSTYFQELRKREEMAKLLIAMSTGDYEDYRLRTYDDLHLHWTGERDLYIFNISAAERKRYRIPFFWSAYATKGRIAREFIFTKPGALSHYQYFASVFLLAPIEANWTDIYSQWADRRVLAFFRFLFWCLGYSYFLWRRFVIPAVKLAWGILDLCIFIIWMISPFYWIGICFHYIFFRAKTYQLHTVFYTGLWSLVWPTLWLIKFLLYLLTGFQPKPACVHTRSQMKGRSSWYAVAAVEVALLPWRMTWIKWTTPSQNYFKVFYNRWYLYDLLWADDGKLLKRIAETGYFFFGRYPWDFAKRILGVFCYYLLFEAKKIRLFLVSKLAWIYNFSFNLVFVILKAMLYVKLSKNSPRTAFVLLCVYLQIAILKGIIYLDRILFTYFGFSLISKTFIKNIINITIAGAVLKAICRLVVELIKWAWRLLMIFLIFLITLPWHGMGTVFGSLICLMLFPLIALHLVQKKGVKQSVFRKGYQLTDSVVVIASRYARIHNQTFTVLYTKVILRAGLYLRMLKCYMHNHDFHVVKTPLSASTNKVVLVLIKVCQVLILKLISVVALVNTCVLRIIPINTIRLSLYYILYLIVIFLQVLRLVLRSIIDFFWFAFIKLAAIINLFRCLRFFNFVVWINYFFASLLNLLDKCTFVTLQSSWAAILTSSKLSLKIIIGYVVKFILSAGTTLVFGVDICIAYLLRPVVVFLKQTLKAVLYIYTTVGDFKFIVWFFSPEDFFKICKQSARFVYNILSFIITLPWQLTILMYKLMFHHTPRLLVKMSGWNLSAWVFVVNKLVTIPVVIFKTLLFKGKEAFLLVLGISAIVYIYASTGIAIPFLFQQGLGLKAFSSDCFSWAVYIGWLCLSVWTILLLSSLTLLLTSALLHCLVIVLATISRAIVGFITYFLRSWFNLVSKLLKGAALAPNRLEVFTNSFKEYPTPLKQLWAKVSVFIIDKTFANRILVLVLGLGIGLVFLKPWVIVYWTIWTALQTIILMHAGIVVINILIISFVIGIILSKCLILLVNITSILAYILDKFFIRYILFVIGAIFKTISILLYSLRWCWHTVADLCPNNKFFKSHAYPFYLFLMTHGCDRVATEAQNWKQSILKVFWDTIGYRCWQLKSIYHSPIFFIKYLMYQINRGLIKFKIRCLKKAPLFFSIINLCKTLKYRQIASYITLRVFFKRFGSINALVDMWQVFYPQLQRQTSLLLHKLYWVKLEGRYRVRNAVNNLFYIERLSPLTKAVIFITNKLQNLFGFFKQDQAGPVQVLWFIYSLPSLLYKAIKPIIQIYSKVFALYFDLFFDGLAFIKSYELIIYKQVVAFYYVPNDRGVLICRPFFTLFINHFWLILMGFFTICGLIGWYIYFILKFILFYIFWVVASLVQFLLICWVTILQYAIFFVIIVPDKMIPAYKSNYHGYRNLASDYTRMFLEQGKTWLLQVYYRHHYNVKLFFLKKGLAYKARVLDSPQLWFVWFNKLVLISRHFVWRYTSIKHVKGFEAFYFLHATDAWDFLIRKNAGRLFLLSSLPIINKFGSTFDGIHTAIFASVCTFHKVRLYFLKLLKIMSSCAIFLRKSAADLSKSKQGSKTTVCCKDHNGSNTNYQLKPWDTKNYSSYSLLALRINHLLKDIFYICLILMVGIMTSYSCYSIFDLILQILKHNLPALFLISVDLYQFIGIFLSGMIFMLSCWIVFWFLWWGSGAVLKSAALKLKHTYSNLMDLHLHYVTFTQSFKDFWFQLCQAPNCFQLLLAITLRSTYIQKWVNKSDLIINKRVRVAINRRLSYFLSTLQRFFTLNLKTMAKLSDEINTRRLLIWQALYRSWETSTVIAVMLGKANQSIKNTDAWLALKVQQILPATLKAKVTPSIDTLWPGATKVPKGIKSKIVFSGFWYKDITRQELPNSLHYGWSRTIYRGALWLYAMPIHFIITGAIESLFWVVMIFVYPLYFWLFYLWAWTWFILNCFRRISLTHKPKGRYWVMADLTNTRYNIRWHYFYKKNSLMLNYKPPKTLTNIRHAVLFKRFCSLIPITALVKIAEFLTQVLITFVRTPIIDPLLNYIGEIYIKPAFFMIATFAVNIGVAYNNRRYRFYRHVSTYFYELKLKWKVLKLSLLWLFMCIAGRFVFKKFVGFMTTVISLSWRAPLLIMLVSVRYSIRFFYAVVESLTIFLSAGFRQFLFNKKLVRLASVVSKYKPLSWAARGWGLILNALLQAPMILYWALTICILKLWYLILLFSGKYVIKHFLFIVRFLSANTNQLDILRGLFATLTKNLPYTSKSTTLNSLICMFDLLVSGQSTSRFARPLEDYKTWRQLMLESFNQWLGTVNAQIAQWEALQLLNSDHLKSKPLRQVPLTTAIKYVLFIEQRIFQIISFGVDRLHRPLTFVIFPFYFIMLRLAPQLKYGTGVVVSNTFVLLNVIVRFLIESITTIVNTIADFLGKLTLRTCATFLRLARTFSNEEERKAAAAFLPHSAFLKHSNRLEELNRALFDLLSFTKRILCNFFAKLFLIPTLFSAYVQKYFLAANLCYRDELSGYLYIYKAHKKSIKSPKKYIFYFINTTYHNWIERPLVSMIIELWKSLIYTPITILRVVVLTFLNTLRILYFPSLTVATLKRQLVDTFKQAVLWKENYSTNVNKVQEYFIWSVKSLTWFLVRVLVVKPLHIVWTSHAFTAKFELFVAYNKAVAWAGGKDYIPIKRSPVSLIGHTILYTLRIWMYIPLILEFYLKLIRRHYYEGYRRYLKRMPASFQAFRRHYSDNRIALSFIQPPEPKELDIIPTGLYKRLETGQNPRKRSGALHIVRYMTISGWHGTRTSFVFFGIAIKYLIWKTSIAMWNSGLSWAIWYFLEGVLGFIWWSFIRPHAIVLAVILDHISQTFGKRAKSELYFLMFIPIQAYIKIPLTALIHTYQARIDKRVWPGVVVLVLGLYLFWKFLLFVHALYVFWPKIALLPASTHLLSISLIIDIYQFINFWLYVAGMSWIYEVVIRPWTLRYFKVYAPALIIAYLMEIHNYVHQDYDIASFILYMAEHLHYIIQFKLEIRYGFSFFWCTMVVFFWPYFLLQWSLLFPWVISHWEPDIVEHYRKLQIPYAEIVRPVYTIGFSLLTAYYNLEFFGTFWFLQLNETDALLNFIAYYGLEDEIWYFDFNTLTLGIEDEWGTHMEYEDYLAGTLPAINYDFSWNFSDMVHDGTDIQLPFWTDNIAFSTDGPGGVNIDPITRTGMRPFIHWFKGVKTNNEILELYRSWMRRIIRRMHRTLQDKYDSTYYTVADEQWAYDAVSKDVVYIFSQNHEMKHTVDEYSPLWEHWMGSPREESSVTWWDTAHGGWEPATFEGYALAREDCLYIPSSVSWNPLLDSYLPISHVFDDRMGTYLIRVDRDSYEIPSLPYRQHWYYFWRWGTFEPELSDLINLGIKTANYIRRWFLIFDAIHLLIELSPEFVRESIIEFYKLRRQVRIRIMWRILSRYEFRRWYIEGLL